MNKLSASAFEIAIKESLTNYESTGESNSLADLYLYHDVEDNSLVILESDNHTLNKVQLTDDKIYNLAYILRQALQQAVKNRLFDRSYIVKPFTVSLVDKDFIVLEELLFLDDDRIKINNIIWKNIEKELDDFIENLLK